MRFVTVIMPTYRDWDRLKLCLNAIENQNYPKEFLEVIIINNEANALNIDLDLLHYIKLVSETKPGSYSARNKGLELAKGEIIAFTDSDCIPDDKWIYIAVDILETGCESIAGHVEFFFKSGKLSLAEKYESIFAFNQKKLSKWCFCYSQHD